jgi:hypothetical protein
VRERLANVPWSKDLGLQFKISTRYLPQRYHHGERPFFQAEIALKLERQQIQLPSPLFTLISLSNLIKKSFIELI